MDEPSWDRDLLRMTNSFLRAGDSGKGLEEALREIEGACGVVACVVLGGTNGTLEPESCAGFTCGPGDEDRGGAVLAFETGVSSDGGVAGAPTTRAWWVPMAGASDVIGVLGARDPSGGGVAPESVWRLKAFAGQLALLLEWANGLRARVVADAQAVAERSRRTLIDLVSHELKSPLSALEAALEGLGGDPAGAAFYLSESLCALRRLCRTVDNLLDMGRLETGAVTPRMDWCDIADICDTAVQLSRGVVEGREVRCDIGPGAPLVRVDEALVCHALMQLLHNAATHTPAGSGITLRASADEGILCLDVMDRGPGVSHKEKEKIFEKFFKGKSAPPGSAGLGLAVARGFVGALGGDISAEQREGGGAVFRIRIPCEITVIDVSDENELASGDAGTPQGN
ncbi:MAG TPA: ATP-binding protein [Verrucomicrobiae bacterium]|nr:ATP-binding protein [Verrucomicrobiae bacterium]